MRLNNLFTIFALLFLLGFTHLQADVPYSVDFQGLTDQPLLEKLRSVSDLVQLIDQPPPTQAALQRRANSDIDKMLTVLKSEGYYDGQVEMAINPGEAEVVINLGQRYTIGLYEIFPENLRDSLQLKKIGIKSGKPAIASSVIEARENVLKILAKEGYPLAEIIEEKIIVDKEAKTLSVRLEIERGLQMQFGAITINGLNKVKEEYVLHRIQWDKDQLFDPDLITSTKTKLEKTGLFTSVQINFGIPESGSNQLPVIVELQESKHRSISLGVGYSNFRGFGVFGEWENRNFRNMGERVYSNAVIRQRYQKGKLSYRKPDFLVLDQDLVTTLEFTHDKNNNFNEHSLSLSGIFEQTYNDQFFYSYGVELEQLLVTKSLNDQTQTLFRLPLVFEYDTTDDLLDPHRGVYLRTAITPNTNIPDVNLAYVKQITMFSGYHSFNKSNRLVLAGRTYFGTIWGAKRVDIPPPDRFYGGTESLLRGYAYLTVSPLDKDDNPLGGRSIFVVNGELRYRFQNNLGLAAFTDIGNVFGDGIPSLDTTILKSVGFGGRYHTPIGPIRLDIAFPLNRRKGIDNSYQIYLNVGQTF